ncbi:MAG: outer membrane beta-barrel protein [Sphingorhabdus sp.]
MVLNIHHRRGLSVVAMALACSPAPLYAQYIGKAAPSLRVSDPEYTSLGLNLGPIKVFSDIDFDLTYDDNVFAESTAENSDFLLTVTPKTELRYQTGNIALRGFASAAYRRFADLSSENSTAAVVEGDAAWQPRIGESVTALGGWTRGVEDRGDPEARNDTSVGPRLSDIFTGRLGYNRQRGKISFKVDGEVRKYNNLSSLDADRNLTSYAGRMTVGHRISGNVFATASGFFTKRDFRIPVNIFGVNRNAETYGGRLGIQMDPGGVVEGSASVGMFHLDSAGQNTISPSGTVVDPDYNGLSIDASVTYRPRQRTAITLDAFRGDVATFRLGAVARTDTQVALGVQQEVRHNIYAQLSGFYRESKFRGLGANEQIVGLEARAEYLFNRYTALGITGRYSKRDSDELTEKYSRFRGGVEARFSF